MTDIDSLLSKAVAAASKGDATAKPNEVPGKRFTTGTLEGYARTWVFEAHFADAARRKAMAEDLADADAPFKAAVAAAEAEMVDELADDRARFAKQAKIESSEISASSNPGWRDLQQAKSPT